jgi:mRNA interferase MazF
MNRGEIWTLRDDGYASKARPVIIVRSDLHDFFDSVILCLFTTFESDDIPTRVPVAADGNNGLKKDSYVMTEKLVTVNKADLGFKIGVLSDLQMHEISGSLAKILDIQKEDIV